MSVTRAFDGGSSRVDSPDVVQRASFVAPRDSVRWGPIFAGLLTALASFLLLSTLALAIGLTVAPGNADQDQTGAAAGIITAVIGLVSFFIGGLVAGRSAAVGGRGTGALNGFLVWALGMLVVLALAAFGLGQLFGAAGDLFGQYRAIGAPTADVDTGQLGDQIRTGAFGAFLGLALPAAAATIGGLLGARSGDRTEADRQPV
jgi:hypothetical protein